MGDLDQAKIYLKRRKTWMKDLERISIIKKQPSIPPPKYIIIIIIILILIRYHFETKETKVEVQNTHLSPHDLEIKIINITHLRAPADSQNLTVYVTCEFGGSPQQRQQQQEPEKEGQQQQQ